MSPMFIACAILATIAAVALNFYVIRYISRPTATSATAPRTQSITSTATNHAEHVYIECINAGMTTSAARSTARAMLFNQYALRADVLSMVLRTAIAQANRTIYPNEYEDLIIDMA